MLNDASEQGAFPPQTDDKVFFQPGKRPARDSRFKNREFPTVSNSTCLIQTIKQELFEFSPKQQNILFSRQSGTQGGLPPLSP
jgi:hypothetical protein